jgi:signal transduction histidine kinase
MVAENRMHEPIATNCRTLADLPRSRVAFDVETPTAVVKRAFDESIDLPGAILVDGEQLFGAISRDALYRHLARPFCLELFLGHPIRSFYEVWCKDVLRLESQCTIHLAAEKALSRSHEMAYEPVLVEDDDGELGLVDVHTILIAQSQLLKLSKEIEAQKEAAEKANRSKSEFLANISHELRTPLHGILSYSQFGLKDVEEVERAELREYFQCIDQSADTLLMLVNDLLDLAKLEAGRMTFDLAPHNLNDLLVAVVDEFRSVCSRQRLTIHLRTSGDASMMLLDGHRIKQVLRNLLANAVKFSPTEDSAVYVAARRVGDTALVSVRDEGPGVPTNEMEAIFDKFMQSSNTNSGSGGTGLGLAICREIVVGHDGRIWVENSQGGGSVFYVELPIRSAATWTADETTEEESLLCR